MFAGDRRTKVLTLLTMCFGLFMAMLDNTVVNVALPSIQKDLHATVSGLQWVVSAYTLALATCMLTGGTLGDLYGRKRAFLAGLVVFTSASFACGVSPTTGTLVAARAVQGVGAALLLPGSLSILTNTFPDPRERAQAIGLWAGISAFALGLGPVIGGLLVDAVGWQSVFFLNVPIGVAAVAVGTRVVRESADPDGRSLDVAGQVLAAVALGCATYAFIEGNDVGWSTPRIVGLLVVAALALIAFLVVELRTPTPMLQLSFFRNPTFSGANFVGFSVGLGMFGMVFFASLYLQQILGYSPTGAAVRLLPQTLCIVVVAPLAGRLAGRVGPRPPLVAGLLLLSASLFAFGHIAEPTSSYASFVWTLPLTGIGMGLTMTPITAAVMGSVPPQRAGMASATTNMLRQVGGSLGIAVLGAILLAQLAQRLRPRLDALGLPADARDRIVAAAKSGGAGNEAHAVVAQVRSAVAASFVDGMRLALVVSVCILAFAALVAAVTVGRGAQRATADLPAPREPVPGSAEPTALLE